MSMMVVDIPQVRVQLFENRAQIEREGCIVLPRGRSLLKLESISPVVVDRSVQCRVQQGRCRIINCYVQRHWRIENADKPEEIAELERLIEEKRQKSSGLSEEIALLKSGLASKSAVYGQTLEDLTVDVSWGRGDASIWRKQLDTIESSAAALFERLNHLSDRKTILNEELGDLCNIQRAKQRPDAIMGADLIVDIICDQDETAVSLGLSYVAPGACWRPCYSATLTKKADRVQVHCDGAIWQHTGEDWQDVAVSFSTERISLGTTPPRLETDLLSAYRTGDTVHVETREEAIVQAGLGKKKIVRELPGIDDGGEPMTLESSQTQTILSNGQMHRSAICSFESDATFELRLLPELDERVQWVTTQTNRAAHPLLPGPVDLIRNGGFIGRSELSYVASGETFELGFGPEDTISVRREKEMRNEKIRVFSSWTEMPYEIRILLNNLGDTSKTIWVKERVLVSEVEKIHVSIDPKKTTDRHQPDGNGFIKWRVSLDGLEARTIELAYTIKRHEDIVGLDI